MNWRPTRSVWGCVGTLDKTEVEVRPARMSALPDRPNTLLNGEPDEALFRRYREGDVSTRDQLVERFMPLARRLARRYRHTAESQDDLEQVAYLGLIKSIDRYDPEAGSFVRYAVPNVLGELKRHFRDKGWGMHVPRSLQERVLKINEAMELLYGRLGRSPSPRDLSEHTGLSLEEVLEALDAASAYSPAALDAPYTSDPDGERTLGETLGDEDGHFELVELGEAIGPTFSALPDREQEIIRLRFVDDLTQAEIAKRTGISQMHVSRLLRRSLDQLSSAAALD